MKINLYIFCLNIIYVLTILHSNTIGNIALIFNLVIFALQSVRIVRCTISIFNNTKLCSSDFISIPVSDRRYVFVIPFYNTDIQIIRNMLTMLADHSKAITKYVIILALEDFEVGSIEKAQLLMTQYNTRFVNVMYTSHVQYLNETVGTVSCINSALRTISMYLKVTDMVIITCAGALIHENYTDALENMGNSTDIFASPLLYDLNTTRTSLLVCIQDYLFAINRISFMNPIISGIGFPMQVYAFSYDLIKKIGYFDTTNKDSTHDIHTFLKAYSENETPSLKMIPVPIFVRHIECDTFYSTFVARYTQSVKHYMGTFDIAFVCKNVIQKFTIKGLYILFKLYELYTFPLINIQTLLIFKNKYTYTLATLILILVNITCYEITRHVSSNKYFYRESNLPWYKTLVYPILLSPLTILFTVLPFIHTVLLHAQDIDFY